MIHREDDEIYETVEVELQKKRERGLGLSIVGKKSGPGVFISEVVKGGAADLDGRLIQVKYFIVWHFVLAGDFLLFCSIDCTAFALKSLC